MHSFLSIIRITIFFEHRFKLSPLRPYHQLTNVFQNSCTRQQKKKRWDKSSLCVLQKEQVSESFRPILNSFALVNNIRFRILYWIDHTNNFTCNRVWNPVNILHGGWNATVSCQCFRPWWFFDLTTHRYWIQLHGPRSRSAGAAPASSIEGRGLIPKMIKTYLTQFNL